MSATLAGRWLTLGVRAARAAAPMARIHVGRGVGGLVEEVDRPLLTRRQRRRRREATDEPRAPLDHADQPDRTDRAARRRPPWPRPTPPTSPRPGRRPRTVTPRRSSSPRYAVSQATNTTHHHRARGRGRRPRRNGRRTRSGGRGHRRSRCTTVTGPATQPAANQLPCRPLGTRWGMCTRARGGPGNVVGIPHVQRRSDRRRATCRRSGTSRRARRCHPGGARTRPRRSPRRCRTTPTRRSRGRPGTGRRAHPRCAQHRTPRRR